MDSRQIIAALKELRVPHERIASAIGRDRSAATKMLSGKRSVKANEIAALTALIDEHRRREPHLEPPQPATEADVRIVPRFLGVRYRVQAGQWYEIEFEEPPQQISLAVVPDPRFANWPQWLELVLGDSVNLKIPPGHYAHVVDAIEMGYAPKPGDWVVVERRRDQGRTRERTIKQVEITADGIVRLRARSTNPIWERATVLAFRNGEPITDAGVEAGDDTTEVEIVGLVIGAYDPSF